jgi:hypothetical protein
MRVMTPMENAWDRLRWARTRWMQAHPDCATAEDVARRFEWKPVTYRSHERAPADNGRGFDADTAKAYAQAFGVSWLWLFAGEGDPTRGTDPDMVPIAGYVGADPEGRILFAQGQGTGDLAPRPPNGSPTAQCLEVRGHSMPFFAEEGSLIWYDDQHTHPTPEMIGQVVVVQLDTDEVLVKRLLRGSAPGLFDLQSISGPPREDARLVWAARIVAIIPPLEARRVIRRGGHVAA